MWGILLLSSWLSLGLGGAPIEPAIITITPRTNLLWNLSDPGVTNYYATLSNWNGTLFAANLGITNRWVGVLTNRRPTFITVTAQASTGNATSVTNFFVPTTYTYSIIAQTGSIGGEFADWKTLGSVSTTGQIMLRLRASVVASNALNGAR